MNWYCTNCNRSYDELVGVMTVRGTYCSATCASKREPSMVAVKTEKAPTLSVAEMARALFETDDAVLAHVRVRSESTPRDHESTKAHIRAYLDVGQRDELGPNRWSRVMQIAWDLNAADLRTKSTERATRMVALLAGDGSVPK